MNAFLWTVVIVMAVALAAEILALGLLGRLALRRMRGLRAIKSEVKERIELTRKSFQELKQPILNSATVVRRNGQEMGSTVRVRFRSSEAAYEDARRRAQRIGLRFGNDGVQTVEQHQRGEAGVRGGIWEPIRAVGSVVGSVGATLWLLRKVA